LDIVHDTEAELEGHDSYTKKEEEEKLFVIIRIQEGVAPTHQTAGQAGHKQGERQYKKKVGKAWVRKRDDRRSD
jgi:hypothetical protein